MGSFAMFGSRPWLRFERHGVLWCPMACYPPQPAESLERRICLALQFARSRARGGREEVGNIGRFCGGHCGMCLDCTTSCPCAPKGQNCKAVGQPRQCGWSVTIKTMDHGLGYRGRPDTRSRQNSPFPLRHGLWFSVWFPEASSSSRNVIH